MNPDAINPEILNSWKEIAAYMDRGVRTVQRWEAELGLPVRRPRGRERSAVIALKADIDRWSQNTPQTKRQNLEVVSMLQRRNALEANREHMRARTQQLIECAERMRRLVGDAMALTAHASELQTKKSASNKTDENTDFQHRQAA